MDGWMEGWKEGEGVIELLTLTSPIFAQRGLGRGEVFKCALLFLRTKEEL